MTFDEQHGWVELGTPGVHGGAVVRDLDAEVAALERMMSHPVMGLGWATRQLPFGVTPGEMLRYKQAHGVHATGVVPRPAQQNDRIIARARVRHGRRHGRVSTTYTVEGGTVRIIHNVQLPAPAQAVNVTMTIGGE